MKIISGKNISEKILLDVKEKISSCVNKPGLGVILVGDDEASKIYVSIKERRAKEIGMNFKKVLLNKMVSTEEILNEIKKLNMDDSISGIIVQMPLPEHIDKERIINEIDLNKDADGFKRETVSKMEDGNMEFIPVFIEAIIELIKEGEKNLKGKRAKILSKSKYFGDTLSLALGLYGVESEVFVIEDGNFESYYTSDVDIVVSALGISNFVMASELREGAIFIDGGISKLDGRVVGDLNLNGAESKNIIISSVPGGVGPVTVSCLLRRIFILSRCNS
jgi:methylenetetrahydrofolate dehydrogenase (NADP+)/methenyltetrahydrofolate cyclohydrolase